MATVDNTATRGMPLLSAPPISHASRAEVACKKCNKEFNILFVRAKKCNHCGYAYCSACSDYHALMPREDHSGYDPCNVCAFCFELLQITAAGRAQLRSMPLAKLRKYIAAYNLKLRSTAIEKDDLVETILSARGRDGCLSHVNEEYYRKNAVPGFASDQPRPRNIFTRATESLRTAATQGLNVMDNSRHAQTSGRRNTPPSRQANNVPPRQSHQGIRSAQGSFPRPATGAPPRQGTSASPRPAPGAPPRPAHGSPPRPTPDHQARSNYSSPHSNPYSQGNGAFYGAYVPPQGHNPLPQSRPAPQATASSPNVSSPPSANPSQRPPPSRSPAPPTPSLDQLLSMSHENLAKLPVSVLKDILFQNHVNAGVILEKSEIVSKVAVLLDEERGSRERDAAERQREEEEYLEAQRERIEEHRAREEEERAPRSGNLPSDNSGLKVEGDSTATAEKLSSLPSTDTYSSNGERRGVCVVCTDAEACIAIVDCGHLALCGPCSTLIMSSTRECPLCRTRIVTESRLLRIFRT